ncbi:MAG: nucleoside monophosphate kinase [Candidatus Paceibacterota bacterium]|jgi:adenylate kinase
MNKNPLVLILLGKSGAGKGTQLNLLKDRLNLEFIGTGELLRQRKKTDDFTGKKISTVIDNGGIIATPIPFKLWMDSFEEIKNNGDIDNGIIIDGSPRKIKEAWLLDDALGWFEWDKKVKIILIDISDEEAISRITRRKTCPQCGKIMMFSKDMEDIQICPECGSELVKRPDDTIEGTKKRLQWFEDEVGQVIKYYEDDNRLIRVNGEQSVEDVYNDIIKVIENDNN